MSLEVSDNGRGLSQDDLGEGAAFGIRGLHERAGTVGGWVDLSSGPAGTVLMCRCLTRRATAPMPRTRCRRPRPSPAVGLSVIKVMLATTTR